jgi:hypothetical protein
MRHAVFLLAILVVAAPAAAQTWKGDLEKGDLLKAETNPQGSISVAWGSKYLWRGFDFYDDEAAVHVQTDVNLFDTGFGLSVMGHHAATSGFEDKQRWDFAPYYQNSLFKDQPYVTQYRVGWVYYAYPRLNEGESLDLQEGHLILSWPSILPVEGLVPTYAAVKMWQANSESRLADGNGWLHFLMLDYTFPIPNLVSSSSKGQPVRLHSELVYNDGFSPTPARLVNDWRCVYPNPDHDWSHAVFGVSTDFDLGLGITFTPGVFYQRTLNNTINEDDEELWAGLTLKWSF